MGFQEGEDGERFVLVMYLLKFDFQILQLYETVFELSL